MTGAFYGVGVGPGDPELMTLKAVRVLKEADAIIVPRSRDTASSGSQALGIAGKAVELSGKEIVEIGFPMTKDRSELDSVRKDAAFKIAGLLKEGKDVAFITLGDPLLYSTFASLIPFVKELSRADIRVIPGITSFSAAASAVNVPIAESCEKAAIIPAAYGLVGLEEILKAFDTVIIMKVNKVMGEVTGLLRRLGLDRSAFLVSRAGLPGEEIVANINRLEGAATDYFSTLIVRKNFSNEG